jgi:hypothetical protein
MENDTDYFLMGISFLRGYYSIHDMQNGLIGFAPHSQSYKSTIGIGKTPRKNNLATSSF